MGVSPETGPKNCVRLLVALKSGKSIECRRREKREPDGVRCGGEKLHLPAFNNTSKNQGVISETLSIVGYHRISGLFTSVTGLGRHERRQERDQKHSLAGA